MSSARAYLADRQESEDRIKATVLSVVFHALLVLLLYFYKFGGGEVVEQPQSIAIELEWGGGGDNAAAGEPDKGMNSDYTPPGESEPTPVPPSATTPPPTNTPVTNPEPTKATTPTTPTTEDPSVAALRKQQEDQRKRDQEAAKQRAADDAARQAAADKARQEEEARKAKVKNNAGSAFGKPGGTGQGAGGGGKPGNGGIPGGTGDNPFGKSNGSGGGTGGGSGGGTGVSIGGGLGGRAVRFRPTISDNSQDVGKIVMEVCVDGEGNVTSATYTLKGSTSQSTALRKVAENAAKKYKFAPSSSGKDCGTIAFNFTLQ